MSMLFDTWKRLIKGLVLRFYEEKSQNMLQLGWLKQLNLCVLIMYLMGGLLMKPVGGVPSHAVHDVRAGIRP